MLESFPYLMPIWATSISRWTIRWIPYIVRMIIFMLCYLGWSVIYRKLHTQQQRKLASQSGQILCIHLALVGVISDYIVLVVATYHSDKDQIMTCLLHCIFSFVLGDHFVTLSLSRTLPELYPYHLCTLYNMLLPVCNTSWSMSVINSLYLIISS